MSDNMPKEQKKRGPAPERLKIKGDWEKVLGRVLRKTPAPKPGKKK
jgi:hypothetical protein